MTSHTEKFRLLHTMLRVKDLDAALDFYTGKLGMRLLRKTDFPSGEFTLAFVGYGDEESHAVIELTHNWGDHDYEIGTAYGHIAIAVPDIYKACDELAAQGVKIPRPAGPMKHGGRPIAFIEDTAVDPKHLPEFVPQFTEIMAKHGADAAYYGHCSVGCLHIRPLINLKTERGLEQVRVMAEEIFDLVLSFGGAISSEHGDGRARSPFLERVFGPTMIRAFKETKAAFDPRGLLNPGKAVPTLARCAEYGRRHVHAGALPHAELPRF